MWHTRRLYGPRKASCSVQARVASLAACESATRLVAVAGCAGTRPGSPGIRSHSRVPKSSPKVPSSGPFPCSVDCTTTTRRWRSDDPRMKEVASTGEIVGLARVDDLVHKPVGREHVGLGWHTTRFGSGTIDTWRVRCQVPPFRHAATSGNRAKKRRFEWARLVLDRQTRMS